ncbi:MAG: hypothetical protein QOF83_2974 [Solirubrobacteraceae bacterium]|jgi:hypothetical protein|nr:hypothetical protein [Solirubrobacteraceae bacterium]
MVTPSLSPSTALFVASTGVTWLDHLRVPYEIGGDPGHERLEQLQPAASGPCLLWPRAGDLARPTAGRLSGVSAQSPPIFSALLSDEHARPLLAKLGGVWSTAGAVTGLAGQHLASVWREEGGSLLLPFDPDETILNVWSEAYTALTIGDATRRGKRALMRAYYRARPLLPRNLQIWLRRGFARVQARSTFPAWPVESGLHDLLDLLLILVADLAGEPVPHIAAWPDDHTWALVLTHDVEQAEGWNALDPVLELERSHGLRSSFNLVPRRYDVDVTRVQALIEDGFEVGVHGLYHDGRDLESEEMVRKRLPGMRDAAQRWGAVGFRSPATHRGWELMPLLGFDYDSSCPDTDPFEPQAGGCCSWLPFFDQDMVELPLTLPQDHTLFAILRHEDESAWVQKADFLRARGGLALIDTHPDYLVDERIMRAYGRFLDRYARDESAWRVLPREVSAWWRRRAASRLERDHEGWRIVGPAAGDGRIGFTG